ncbi:MAG: type II secretion system F family protein [Candidatus Methylomirabilis oxygeniifera]|uniref:Type 4 fimbrial assembly protein pilC n=1 Tax=Methylomirabilis oxygeniifera TaxID=671143 RepID=D5MMG2_METO1|nr:MAG: type II secretion system F family protein [Candidatus Methylomirabilis oxyfera]CBE70084.1 Type 4 fimbrial assembly protein pilC [Candidatus Methylomirabilis oxyfera]
MPTFAYRGRSQAGRVIAGRMEATTAEAVVAQLRQQRIFPISVKPQPKAIELKIPGFGGKKVKDKDLAVFTRQLATMIDAGLPLVQCLDTLASQQPNKGFKNILAEIREDVEGGSTFTTALKRHPTVFTPLYANMVEAGEAGGMLDTILNRLAVYIEKATTLRRKVKGALIYPSTIVVVAIAVVVFLLIFVIPVFAGFFEGSGVELPLPTQIVMTLSRLVRTYILACLGFLIAGVVGIRFTYKTEKGRRAIDALFLRIPVFGALFRKVAVARFTRTLGTLIASGVPILDGLDITAKTTGNKVAEEAIMKTRGSIAEGKTIADPLKISGVFPPMVVQMISVGEQSGSLDSMLEKIADFYDAEVDQAVANLTALIEPILMVFLGVVVGGMIVAMYLPIFKLVTVIGK